MELCLGRMSHDIQDEEMFSLVQEYHAKAMAKFLEVMRDRLTESQMKTLDCPLRVTFSGSLRTSGGNAKNGMFITLNHRLLKQNMDDLEWIYVHELAHIICQRLYPSERGHGRTWSTVNSYLGFEAKRTHNLNTEGLSRKTKRYSYFCGCQVHNITVHRHNKILKGASYRCKKCKGNLVIPTGEVLEMARKLGINFGEKVSEGKIG